ncbi:MAG TPA: alpha/beta hydrolase [Stellaceae bacterium]|nr:alpha/beta hydrolase [Stellaceae bacterium]
METSFDGSLDDVLDEVVQREASYFSLFPIAFADAEREAERYLRHPTFRGHSGEDVVRRLTEAIAYFASNGVQAVEGRLHSDAVARVLLDGAMDGKFAQRCLSRSSAGSTAGTLPQTLERGYDERRLPNGARYFVRRTGAWPLVLISATGVPLDLWSNLLADSGHDFRIVIVESRCTDLFSGGIRTVVDLGLDADDVSLALDHEGLHEVDVVAWCSGAKVALEFARRHAGRARSLALISPSFDGARGVEARPSEFEKAFHRLFSAARRRPTAVASFVSMLEQMTQSVNWDRLRQSDAARAAALFGLPAKRHASAMIAPMSRPDCFLSCGERVRADVDYPASETLQSLDLPMLLITGDHDNIINTSFAADVMSRFAKNVTHAVVGGAGHYVHDLQYRYLLPVLSDFIAGLMPVSCARVTVSRLGEAGQMEDMDVGAIG